MRKTSMDLTSAVRYNSLASACGRLLATACLAVGAGLFINESTTTEAVAKEIQPFDIKEYIQSHLTVNTYQCLDTLATKESNWNFKAKNGSHHGFLQGRSQWLATAKVPTENIKTIDGKSIAALSKEVLIVEGLELNEIPEGRYKIFIMPLKIPKMDGLPARVLAEA